MNLTQALMAGLLGLAAPHVLACFTVYDQAGRVVYNEPEPPVDMSRPLHETLPARFPGGHMVFDTQTDCLAVQSTFPLVPRVRVGTPLLTDRRTAQSMNVPYTVLADGIALVPAPAGRMRPGVTVVPAEAVAAARPSPGIVITELRNPPVTIVESGDRVAIGEASR